MVCDNVIKAAIYAASRALRRFNNCYRLLPVLIDVWTKLCTKFPSLRRVTLHPICANRLRPHGVCRRFWTPDWKERLGSISEPSGPATVFELDRSDIPQLGPKSHRIRTGKR